MNVSRTSGTCGRVVIICCWYKDSYVIYTGGSVSAGQNNNYVFFPFALDRCCSEVREEHFVYHAAALFQGLDAHPYCHQHCPQEDEMLKQSYHMYKRQHSCIGSMYMFHFVIVLSSSALNVFDTLFVFFWRVMSKPASTRWMSLVVSVIRWLTCVGKG